MILRTNRCIYTVGLELYSIFVDVLNFTFYDFFEIVNNILVADWLVENNKTS